MKILTGLCLLVFISPALAAETELPTSNSINPNKMCVYESRFYSEGSLVQVDTENKIFIQCVREIIEKDKIEYSLFRWKTCSAPQQQEKTI